MTAAKTQGSETCVEAVIFQNFTDGLQYKGQTREERRT